VFNQDATLLFKSVASVVNLLGATLDFSKLE
jgi:hypothetical protein